MRKLAPCIQEAPGLAVMKTRVPGCLPEASRGLFTTRGWKKDEVIVDIPHRVVTDEIQEKSTGEYRWFIPLSTGYDKASRGKLWALMDNRCLAYLANDPTQVSICWYSIGAVRF